MRQFMSEIPQTLEEAEMFLRRTLDHVSGLILYRRTPANEQACAIIRTSIETVQNDQIFGEILRNHPLITPAVREMILREKDYGRGRTG